MKVDPLKILLNENFNLNNKFYFISGNEVSLIEKVYKTIVERYQKKEDVTKIELDTIDNFKYEETLLESKKIFFARNCKGFKKKNIDNLKSGDGVFIFIQENSQKTKAAKEIFNGIDNSCIIDCYELNKSSKIKILNEFLEKKKTNISEEAYWFLVNKLDNRYAFLENSLNTILEIDVNSITLQNIKKLISPEVSMKENLFFQMFKKNSEITEMYKDKIVSNTDVNELYYSCKYFCQLIIDSRNVEDYNKKIPRYLFKEKNYLVEVYKKYDLKKKKKILNILSNMEKILRKDGNLSIAYGLRFILNIKKITVS
mgnify:FL=1